MKYQKNRSVCSSKYVIENQTGLAVGMFVIMFVLCEWQAAAIGGKNDY